MPKLSIDVEGRIASFMDSIDKAEARTNKFVKNMEGSVAAGFKGLVTAMAAGFSTAALLGAFRKTTDHMAALKDASDQTGASVEELSSLLNTLAPSGASIDEITRITSRLAQSMAEAEKGTGKAAEAFAALGVQTKDANGNLRPIVEVLDEVARRLNGYADGTNKVAIAQGLLGESGARSLGILRDLAETTRAASSVTTAQAEAADEFQKSMGRLNVELERFKIGVASDIIPTISRLITEFNEGKEAAGGFWAAVLQFGTDSTDLGTNVEKYRERLGDLRGELELLNEQAADPSRNWTERQRQAIEQNRKNLEESIAQTERALSYYKARQRDAALAGPGGVLDPRDAMAMARPALPPAPTMTGSGSGRSSGSSRSTMREMTRDFEDQAERTRRAVADLITSSEVVAMREYGQQVEYLNHLYNDLGLDAEVYDSAMKKLTASMDALGDTATKALQDQADAWLDLADPMRQFIRDLEEIDLLTVEGFLSTTEAEKIKAAIGDFNKELSDSEKYMVQFYENAQDNLGDGLYNMMQGNFDNIGKSFADMLQRMIADAAAADIMRSLFGSSGDAGGGGSTGSAFGSLIGGLFGGPAGASIGGSVGGFLDKSLARTQPQMDMAMTKSAGYSANVYQTINVDSRSDQASIRDAMNRSKEQAKSEILHSMRTNGVFARH